VDEPGVGQGVSASVTRVTTIPGYEVMGPAGFGAAGAVLAVRDERGEPWVATIVPEDERIERIRRLAELRHAHLPEIHQMVKLTGGRVAVVMELVVGPALATLVNSRSSLGAGEVVTVWRAAADALAALHGRGLVHGDVSPANILIGPGGRPVLIDVIGHGGAERGHTGYVPPELDDGPATAPADVWSLGRTLAWASGDDPAVLSAVGSALADDPRDRPTARDFATWAFLLGRGAPVELPSAPTLAGAQLRAASAPTVLAPHRRVTTRVVAVAGVAVLVAAAVMALASPVAGARDASAPPTPRGLEGWSTLTEASAAEVVGQLLERRDQALADRDAAALDGVYVTGVADRTRDEDLIREMVATDLVFEGYGTAIEQLSAVARSRGTFTARLEVRQLAHRRILGGEIVEIPAQRAHCVDVDLTEDGPGWRIAEVRTCRTP